MFSHDVCSIFLRKSCVVYQFLVVFFMFSVSRTDNGASVTDDPILVCQLYRFFKEHGK